MNFKKIIIAILVVLVLIQFIRVDKNNPTVDMNKDFVTITHADPEVTTILKNSCYDCHSNESYYPWYTNFAPFSWWIKHHINEGREHLNFSIWGTYEPKKSEHKLDECIEMLEENEMPLSSYTIMHGQAKLSVEQRSKLINFFRGLKTDELPETEYGH